MSEQNKANARTFFETLWNKKDMSIADKLIAPDAVPHGPFTDQLPPGGEGQKLFAGMFINAFPDVHCTVDHQEDDGDLVKSWLTFQGTHTGPLMDIPPTGRRVTVKVVATGRWAGGKLVELGADWDPNDMMRQLGVS